MTRALGERLRDAGLTPRRLAAWAGTDRISALPVRIAALAKREPLPAAVALALFVAGRDVDTARVPLPLDELARCGLVEVIGDTVHALVAILPVENSLIVCDRHDAPPTRARVCWPDDSSYHLAGAIPRGRLARWLDLGCGSAFAPLVRPEVATTIVGVELNVEAARMAALGAALSGVNVATCVGDLAIDQPPAELVTCNAPMPGAGTEIWRHADDELFARLWRLLPDRISPGGLAIVHAALSAIPSDRLAGDRRITIYTPHDVPAFAVLWWRPTAPDRLVISRRPLTAERPHIDDADRGS